MVVSGELNNGRAAKGRMAGKRFMKMLGEDKEMK